MPKVSIPDIDTCHALYFVYLIKKATTQNHLSTSCLKLHDQLRIRYSILSNVSYLSAFFDGCHKETHFTLFYTIAHCGTLWYGNFVSALLASE